MDKKREKLGMNPSTAHRRLLKDLLFKFIILAGYKCYRCKKELTREDMTIDHINPWLNSDDPIKNFFDLDNIAFSHMACNLQESVDRKIKFKTEEEKLGAQRKYNRERMRKRYTYENRRQKYLTTGH